MSVPRMCGKSPIGYAVLVRCMLGIAVFGFALAVAAAAHAAKCDSSLLPAIRSTFPVGLTQWEAGPVNETDARYGAFLFGSALLSSDGTVACASCHVPALGFSGREPVAVGVGGRTGTRRPPSLFNLYDSKLLMLDGRAKSLEDQIHLPLESPLEMNVDWSATLARLKQQRETVAFLSDEGRPTLDRDLVIRSLVAYVRTLVSGDSPFDRYYFGGDESAISAQAKDGLLVFVRKGRCSGCHLITGYSAPLTDDSFHSTGIGFENGVYKDSGRGTITGQQSDAGRFKTPTLRNVSQRRYFMHDGSMRSLREVLDYYNRGGNPGAPNMDGRVKPLFLTEPEIDALIAFLNTLDAPVVRYRPSTAGNH